MVYVKGWNEGGRVGLRFGKMRFQYKRMLYWEMGKAVCPHLVQPFHENLYKVSNNNRHPNLTPEFEDIRRKGWSSSPVMSLTLERDEEKESSEPHLIRPWISWMWLSSQPEVIFAARKECPVAGVPCRWEGQLLEKALRTIKRKALN